MRPYRGIPQVEILPFSLRGGPLRVTILRYARIQNTDAVQREWDRLREGNPRLFDGPILSVLHGPGDRSDGHGGAVGPGSADHAADASDNQLVVRRDRFARLAVQPGVRTGVRLLAVTAVLTARDGVGREWVLLGRRATGTRCYPGMWELGPSGGVDPPPEAVTEMDHDALLARVSDEVHEEVGLRISRGQALGIARDHRAMSDDIVFVCDVGRLEDVAPRVAPANWEYLEVLWLPTDSVAPFEALQQEAGQPGMIPPTRALLRALGWMDAT